MSDVQKVCAILSERPGWREGQGQVDPLPVTAYAGSDESCASAIYSFAMAMPYADPVDRVWWSFGGGSHFVTLNTYQALGMQPLDPPSPEMPAAYRAEDAIELARQGWRFDGKTQFIDMSKPDRVAEFKRREAFAENIPPTWKGVDPVLYWYLVLEGTVNSQPPDLGWRPDANARNWYGFTFQQYLDNGWAQKEGKPVPWKKGGVPA